MLQQPLIDGPLIDAPDPDETFASGASPNTRETSAAALEAMQGRAGTQRRRVYDFIKEWGPVDDRAIQTGLGMDGSSERPRRRELQKAGVIRPVVEDEGSTQKTVRWVATFA